MIDNNKKKVKEYFENRYHTSRDKSQTFSIIRSRIIKFKNN